MLAIRLEGVERGVGACFGEEAYVLGVDGACMWVCLFFSFSEIDVTLI